MDYHLINRYTSMLIVDDVQINNKKDLLTVAVPHYNSNQAMRQRQECSMVMNLSEQCEKLECCSESLSMSNPSPSLSNRFRSMGSSIKKGLSRMFSSKNSKQGSASPTVDAVTSSVTSYPSTNRTNNRTYVAKSASVASTNSYYNEEEEEEEEECQKKSKGKSKKKKICESSDEEDDDSDDNYSDSKKSIKAPIKVSSSYFHPVCGFKNVDGSFTLSEESAKSVNRSLVLVKQLAMTNGISDLLAFNIIVYNELNKMNETKYKLILASLIKWIDSKYGGVTINALNVKVQSVDQLIKNMV